MAPLFAIVALGYVALTLGGVELGDGRHALGRDRDADLERRAVFPLLAVMHALIFWFSVGLLTPLILLVGLFTARRQLLHDLLLGTVVVNSAALVRLEGGARRDYRFAATAILMRLVFSIVRRLGIMVVRRQLRCRLRR